jgi:mono/diheme cytochrome c family protein
MKRLLFLVVVAVIVTVVYNMLMYYDNNSPFGRMRETPAVRPYENPIPVMAAGTVPFRMDDAPVPAFAVDGEALYRAARPESIASPLVMTDPNVIRQGEGLYFTYCHQCHGKYHDGNGTVGQSFSPLPTDLRISRIQSASDGYLFKHISYGVGGGGRQPALDTTVAIADRWPIIAYIKSLGVRN